MLQDTSLTNKIASGDLTFLFNLHFKIHCPGRIHNAGVKGFRCTDFTPVLRQTTVKAPSIQTAKPFRLCLLFPKRFSNN